MCRSLICSMLLLVVLASPSRGLAFAGPSIEREDFATFWAGRYLDLARSAIPEDPRAAFAKGTVLLAKQAKEVPSFGYTSVGYAAHLTLTNTLGKDIRAGLIAYGPIEQVFLQHEAGGQLIAQLNEGLHIPLPKKSFVTMFRYPHFNIVLKPGRNDLYIGERAVAPHFPILLLSAASLEEFVQAQNAGVVAVLSVTLAIFLMSLFVLMIFRDKITAIYVASFVFSTLFNLYITGGLRPLIYQLAGSGGFADAASLEAFIYKNWIAWWGLMGVSTALFGVSSLEMRLRSKSLSSLIVYISLVSSLLLPIAATIDAPVAINVFSVPYQVVVIVFIFKSVARVRAGYPSAVFSLLAWLIYEVATTVQLLYFFGFIAPSAATSWGLVAASLGQFFLLGAGIFWERKHKDRLNAMQLVRNFRELADRDKIIQEFTSPKILAEISLGQDPRLYKSRWEELSILYSDMRQFTTFVQHADKEVIEELLNCYIGEIIDCTVEHAGEVNKMIGDATLCIYDNPQMCLTACIDMRKRLSSINKTRVNEGRLPIKFGTGAAHAKVISMNIGRQGKRLDRTVIGDEVNIASRVEALTKELMVDVLVAEHFQALISDYPMQRVMGRFRLKGRSESTTIYEIFGHNTDRVIEFKLSTQGALREVLELSIAGHFSEAIRILDELLAKCPDHSFYPGKKLDLSLVPIRNHIVASSTEKGGGVSDGKQVA